MKAIYPSRHYSRETMTVGELIAELQKKYDPMMPVVATWEGTLNAITLESFSYAVVEGETQLHIDVENN